MKFVNFVQKFQKKFMIAAIKSLNDFCETKIWFRIVFVYFSFINHFFRFSFHLSSIHFSFSINFCFIFDHFINSSVIISFFHFFFIDFEHNVIAMTTNKHIFKKFKLTKLVVIKKFVFKSTQKLVSKTFIQFVSQIIKYFFQIFKST